MTGLDRAAAGPRPVDEAALSPAPRLFAIDIDHTLITDDHRLAAATIEAVRHVRDRGAEVVLASSRPPLAMWRYLSELGLTGAARFVSLQGALVGRYTAEGALTVESSQPMDIGAAMEVVRVAAEVGLAVSWYRDEAWLVSRVDAGIEREGRIVQMTPVPAELDDQTDAPQKLLLIDPDPAGAATSQVVARLPAGLAATRSNAQYLEVTTRSADKGVAVAAVAAGSGIAREEVVAIGDGPNDLGMFAVAGVTVAPANASEVIMRVAQYRTSSNDDDGVAKALRALLP